MRAATRRELGVADDAYVALFAGSGWERKGLKYAIDAAGQASRSKPVLVVAGRGNRRTFAASDRVRFLGPVTDMNRYLSAVEVFILPTIYDPFSNACLEALGAGLPVITTTANGFSEIIEPGVEGEVVTEPSDVAALAAALEKWSDPRLRRAIKPRLQALAAKFDVASNFRATIELLDEYRSALSAL
jgi:UDP-glucose:(heptosyl)LPS alpha-1,3-glucosyltransferase